LLAYNAAERGNIFDMHLHDHRAIEQELTRGRQLFLAIPELQGDWHARDKEATCRDVAAQRDRLKAERGERAPQPRLVALGVKRGEGIENGSADIRRKNLPSCNA